MNYDTDKQIVAERINEKKVQDMNIQKTVKIGGKSYDFQKRTVAGKLSMLLPTCLESMSNDAARIKYPSEHRPQIILSDKSGEINITFSDINTIISNANIEQAVKEWRLIIKKMHPSFVVNNVMKITKDNLIIPYYDYISIALDDKIFNIMFAVTIEDATMLGTFLCPQDVRKYWKALAVQMIGSIRKLEK